MFYWGTSGAPAPVLLDEADGVRFLFYLGRKKSSTTLKLDHINEEGEKNLILVFVLFGQLLHIFLFNNALEHLCGLFEIWRKFPHHATKFQ